MASGDSRCQELKRNLQPEEEAKGSTVKRSRLSKGVQRPPPFRFIWPARSCREAVSFVPLPAFWRRSSRGCDRHLTHELVPDNVGSSPSAVLGRYVLTSVPTPGAISRKQP